jgi:signal transduction histidine kinase
LLPALNQHSSAVGLAAGWTEQGVLSQPERLQIAGLTGSYRNELQALAFRLAPADQAAYSQLTSGTAWRLATSGEDNAALHGTLGVPLAEWLSAENTVSAKLVGLWSDSYKQAQTAAAAVASQTLSRAILLGSLALALAAAAFAVSLILANRLVNRLRRLRTRTLELADVQLPSIVARLGNGERVDVESELGKLDYGSDEIGQVAEAFDAAQRTAVAAAGAEASTRSGISKVFLDIAHRSQLVVHRQLELLDIAEARQGDPEHLELLFQLDHLATRARRNAENLLILGGGQPGRKWRRPAALEDVVRSAVSETEHFARVDTVRLPSVQVQGGIVGDLIHLLAELIDNATAFSPPDAPVTVRGNVVGKGVVVEIEDQGLGIERAERERHNETLRNPPGFQAMALSGQRHLGLFVVGQLAVRHGITVSLLESAYGGIKAIVLIPVGAVEAPDGMDGVPSASGRPGRHEQLPAVPAQARQPAPRLSGSDGSDSFGRAIPPPGMEVYDDSRRPAATSAPAREVAPSPAPGPARAGRAPLPRRERMANLAPGLRPDAGGDTDDSAPRRPQRSPEEARGSMSAFQHGTRTGRNVAGKDK